MKRLLLIAIIIFCSGQLVFAWDDCPHGKTNDSFPGECGRYVDTNQDNICDHSQKNPNAINMIRYNKKEKAQEQEVKTEKQVSEIGVNEKSKNKITPNINSQVKKTETTYHLIPITAILLGVYFISKILLKTKKIKLLSFRSFWNTLLLISFLFVGLTGVLLIIQVNFSLKVPLPFNVLYWHSEIGIIIFVICIFHIIERWSFFKRMLRGFI